MTSDPNEEIHVTKTEARAGSTPNIVRYVLLISIALAVIGLMAVMMGGMTAAPEQDEAAVATGAESSPARQ